MFGIFSQRLGNAMHRWNSQSITGE